VSPPSSGRLHVAPKRRFIINTHGTTYLRRAFLIYIDYISRITRLVLGSSFIRLSTLQTEQSLFKPEHYA
jgi:hypothetical protein